ncbi:MAG: hypothetical protein D6689_00645 [Deltaproteobacteria bacterium]|nr:MAG: hypothetical protein D6689_00645 [Deltaproteobacteria bacterium]
MGQRALIAAIAAAAGAGAAALAAGGDRARPTLHEYIDLSSVTPDARLFGAVPAPGRNPEGFSRGDKIVPRPPGDAPPAPTEPIYGRSGADRDTRWRADRQTGPDDALHYVEVFNPSVVPFKRMTALDAVDADYVLSVAQPATADLAIGGDPDPDRDLFWASLVVDLRPGDEVPIPSVAPDMRILSYETAPPVPLVFSKDGADNFYVRSDETGVAGPHRLVFLADADARYFAPDVPGGFRIADIPRGLARPLPEPVRRSADRALRELGLHRGMTVKRAVDLLARTFRAFEAGPLPRSTDDLFWDLFSARAGVCRHRSFAFMVTANALGIPTRYVSNEAHAWVEVWVPDAAGGRWLRVDLGGAALRLDVANASDKAMHRPRGVDTLPQPPEYAGHYTRLEGDVRGLSAEQLAEARSPLPSPGAEPDDPSSADATGEPARPAERTVAPGRSLPEMPASAYEGKVRTAIAVDESPPDAFRGEPIAVRGRLVDADGLGIAGGRVDIYLAPAGRGGDGATRIGRAVTGPDGTYRAHVRVPADLPLGDYEIYAATPGDATYAPALSDR